MKFNTFYFEEDNLAEMLVIGSPKDSRYIIAFDKWIWFLNSTEEQQRDILSKLNINPDDLHMDLGDDYDFMSAVQEHKNDVLVGEINKKNLNIHDSGSFKSDPKSSVLVAKVVKQLKLNSASYTEDIDSTETKLSKKKMTMQIPDIGFHGTTSKYLDAIMRKGLMAGQASSNYARQGIDHPHLIFFATRIGEAMGHATTTAHQQKGTAIILEFQIPDKSQVIADYDVERLTDKSVYYGDTGPEKKHSAGSYQQDPDKLSRHFGVYGYKSRIPASFIKYVYVATKPNDELYSIADYKKMKPKTAQKMLDMGYFDF